MLSMSTVGQTSGPILWIFSADQLTNFLDCETNTNH